MTRSEMRDIVVLNLQSLSGQTTLIDAAFDLCLRTEVLRRHRFSETLSTPADATIDSSALPTSLAFPTGMVEVTNITLIDGLNSLVLDIRNKKWLEDRYPSISSMSTGKPLFGWLESGFVWFVPRADNDYDVRFTGTIRPTMASEDTAEPTVTVVDDALIAYATAFVYQSLERFESAQYWRGRFEEAMALAIVEDRRKPAVHVYGSEEKATIPGEYWLDPFVKRMPK